MLDYLPHREGGLPSSMGGLYGIVLNLLLGVGIVVTLIGLIMAGIMFITSKGDPKATDKAKHALTYSIVGMLLAVGAFSVKALVLSSLGINNTDLSNPVPGF